MKNELQGDKEHSGEMGLLDLTVATNSSSSTVVTKAVTDVVEDFPVYIVAAPGDTTKRFDSFADLKEQNPIELPVGTYTVVSNSPVPYEKKMQYPYYKGEEPVTISDVTATTTVTCTIQNVKITFVPSAAFRTTYSDWTINVSDHIEDSTDALIATFTPANSGTEGNQAFEYWKLGDDVDKIYITGTATVRGTNDVVQVYGVAEKKNLQGHTDEDGNFLLYNKDGEVIPAAQKTEADKRYMGNYIPKVMLGWNNSFMYKNFDLNINMRSWIKFDVYNMINMYFGIQGIDECNVLKDAYGKFNHIRGEKQICDYYLEDGTFLKIDAISLGYSLSLKNYCKWVDRFRIYATVGNVCMFTKYSGVNPEVDIAGWDKGTERFDGLYPLVRTYTLGLQLTF